MAVRMFSGLAATVLCAALWSCGGGGDDASTKTATIDPPNCAASGACR